MRLASRGARSAARSAWTRATTLVVVAVGLLSGCSAAIGPDDIPAPPDIPGADPDRLLPQDALRPFGPVAETQDDLWDITYLIAVVVFALVFGGLAFIALRYRAKDGDAELPRQIHGNTRLEILWTLIPVVILAGLAFPTVSTVFALQDEPQEGALIVDVVGKQYWWHISYVDSGVVTANELYIPTDREVFINLAGEEDPGGVLHSFWVPSLAGKRDYVPGANRILRIEASEEGVYPGQCAEFCGLSHANMRFTVIAVSPEEFEAYLDHQSQPVTSGGDVAEGEAVVGANCLGCHAIQGHPQNVGANIAPDLTHFASRQAFAGYIFENDIAGDAELVEAWVRNPPAVKPGAQMPAFGADVADDAAGLSDAEIDAVIAYLRTLE